jgi:hypothetical protein
MAPAHPVIFACNIDIQPPLSSSFLTREVVEVKSLGLEVHQGAGRVVFVSATFVQLRSVMRLPNGICISTTTT